MARAVCLRMGCLTGCNGVVHTSRLVCSGLVRVIDLYAMIPWGVNGTLNLSFQQYFTEFTTSGR